MAPVLAPEPLATASPMAPAINKRGRLKRKITSQQNIFRGEKKKIQGTPTPVKHAATKGARSKAKKAPKPNSLPGYKVVSDKKDAPHNKGPPSPKRLEREDEGIGEDYN